MSTYSLTFPDTPSRVCCLARQDEVLSHRLGLVPLNVHPDTLAWRSAEDAINQDNTLVLRLALACTRKPGVGLGATAGPGIKDEDLNNGRGRWRAVGQGVDGGL